MGKRILIIEDDQELRDVLADYLKLKGQYEVETAEDGLKGLKLLKSSHFDLVITDITMPYVSGIGILTIIKRDHPEIPVIAITGYGEEVKSLAQEKEADAVLAKPINTDELLKLLNKMLAKGGSHAA
ncbi:MAG TPA: response regulator [Thermodesulfatator atlanticus]|uniref:Response regulator n=1 Tax=Thermodesulfatator atlanticus TaxID=501497 RepID=A0A7V5P186_9BACT|nr:response regulator [Thermodesulfatator atlanticus]